MVSLRRERRRAERRWRRIGSDAAHTLFVFARMAVVKQIYTCKLSSSFSGFFSENIRIRSEIDASVVNQEFSSFSFHFSQVLVIFGLSKE